MGIITESWQDYLSAEKMNISTLIHGATSMRHLLEAMENPKQLEGAHINVGHAVHSLVEGSDVFEKRFAVIPEFAKSPENVTGAGAPSTSSGTSWVKDKVREFGTQNQGKELVKQADFDRAMAMLHSFTHDPVVADVLSVPRIANETSVYAKLADVACKGRVDLMGNATVWDIKTTARIDPKSFGRTFISLQYDLRLAFYDLLLRANDFNCEFKIIAVESAPPWDVAVISIPRPVLENAHQRVWNLLARYKTARESDYWPGVANGKECEIEIPQWAMMEEEIQW